MCSEPWAPCYTLQIVPEKVPLDSGGLSPNLELGKKFANSSLPRACLVQHTIRLNVKWVSLPPQATPGAHTSWETLFV